jgi:hypothetical protein
MDGFSPSIFLFFLMDRLKHLFFHAITMTKSVLSFV